MQDLIIFGAGGFSKDVHFIIDTINQISPTYNLLGFLDDNTDQPAIINGVPYLGTRAYLSSIDHPVGLVIAIGNKIVSTDIMVLASNNAHISFPNIVHPSCYIDFKFLELGRGNVFNAYCIVSRNCIIGDFNLFNQSIGIGHDVVIGNNNVFNPKVQISGGVKIGDNNFFGLNASILQYKEVGDNNMIGACSFVAKNLKNDRKVFGIPAKNMVV